MRDRPTAVFLGGDLLPHSALSVIQAGAGDFVYDYLVPGFTRTRDTLGVNYPDIFLILGNDDPRCEEDSFVEQENCSWEQSCCGRVIGKSISKHPVGL